MASFFSFLFFFFLLQMESRAAEDCGESEWRMYDELDRLSRSVVVWLKEVRYPLAALQARGSRRGALPTRYIAETMRKIPLLQWKCVNKSRDFTQE